MNIMATVKIAANQVTHAWELIPRDEERDEDAILIVAFLGKGDIIGIPLDSAHIQKLDGNHAAELSYLGSVDLANAEFIPRVELNRFAEGF